jgi:hypothetical protein
LRGKFSGFGYAVLTPTSQKAEVRSAYPKERGCEMPINIELPDDFFTDDERQKLKDLFRAQDDTAFSEALQKVVRAALSEFKEMFLGMGLPSRADEIRQHRLFHLVKHYFVGRLPTEAEVSSMFQLTQSRSRGLIRSIMTRFHYNLEQEIRNTLRATIEEAQFDDDSQEYRVVIQSDNVLEELNRIIGMVAPRLNPLRKVRNMSRTYSISEDSYDALCKHLGITRSKQT